MAKRSDLDLSAELRGGEPDEEECPGVGTHVGSARPGCHRLTWIAYAPGDCRRVVDYTCHAHTLSYELVVLAGVYFVRRTRLLWDDRNARIVRVIDYSHESWARPQSRKWWLLLVTGAAR
jgi:hypothetical protein